MNESVGFVKLVTQAQLGDQKSMDHLAEVARRRLFAYLYRLTLNHDLTLDLLQDFTDRSMVWVEYGLQSIHDRTLDIINRGHNAACFESATRATRNRSLLVCAHVILGLPGENRQMMRRTAEALAEIGVDGI